MQTRIDTSAAGFTSMPCYFAQLMGPLWDRGTGVYIPAFFPSIAEATTSGFTFRLLMLGIPRQQVTEIQPESAPAVERIAKESNASRIASIAELARGQRVVRLAKEANLRPGDQLLISATGGASGEIEPQFALVAGVDTKENLATLQFDAAGSPPQLANEFSAFTVFNPGFVTFFTAFARRQKLHVCWLGCQSEMRRPAECPGVIPIPSPCDQILS
jgi:hypothetical protein